MRFRNVIIALGVLIVIEPLLRFPSSWDDVVYGILGFFVIALAYMSRG
ncbi:MAG TPA: hypothetical protein VHE10_00535 [Candidatus Paceibacterota bacterium]|nr:hypothetical protein [Candidatus Paceibacterota bacterium]